MGRLFAGHLARAFLLNTVFFFKFACCKDPFKSILKIILFFRRFDQRMHYNDTERFEILSFAGMP